MFGKKTRERPTMSQMWGKKQQASIKGMFVNGHVAALERAMGPGAVEALEARFGGPVRFDSFEPVPVRDEVRILELSLDLMNDGALGGAARSLEAGRLHFANFSETTLGSALMRSLPRTRGSLKTLLLNAPSIARIVFDGTTFTSDDVHEGVMLTVSNCDYPVEHFQGFFDAWMAYWGVEGGVRGRESADGVFEYRLTF